MSSIWRHPKSQYWTACFRDQHGRQRRISTKETNRHKAQKIAEEYEKAARLKRTLRQTRDAIERLHSELTGHTLCSSVSLRTFAETWLETKKAEAAPRTLEFYCKSAKKLLSYFGPLADDPLSEITKNDLIKFRNALSALGLASKTVNHHLKCSKMIFRAAWRDGVLSEDPAEFVASVRSPKNSRTPSKRPFSIPQLRAVLSLADPEWRSLVLFGLYTGQRLGDIARLRWSNIDLNRDELRLVTAKTSKSMIIPLASPLRRHIEKMPSSDDPQTPLHPRACATVDVQGRSGTLSRQFGELLVQAGLREKQRHRSQGKTREGARTSTALSFHSLRRTATTLLHEAGIPQAVAQALIGHDSAAMHEVYISVGREALVRAAEVFPEVL
jgi:integrase